MAFRKYPVGIQTFPEIIREGYVYVDKTDLVWEMTHYAKFVFMSRPRRFGKSLLASTLEAYFRGERELFEELKIMQKETLWQPYPVIRLDLSGARHMPPAVVRQELERILEPYEELYERKNSEVTPGMRFAGVVQRAYEKTGRRVAVIIDEYDAPLLDVLHEDVALKEMREVVQEFYQRLKMLDPFIHFCFITGITKFSQLSIFSTLNNLVNITLNPKFSAICGITEEELTTVLTDDIRDMAIEYDCSSEEMHTKIKNHYDGYHFSEKSADIYNPFSLLNAFLQKKIGNYWFDTGTPTYLIRQLQLFHADITNMDDIEVPASAFDLPTEAMHDALPLLYQSGYVTIKDYNREEGIYRLSMPNQEVRSGYAEGLLPVFTGLKSKDVQTGFALKFWRALKKNDIDLAMREMQSYLAGIPYVEGFKKKLEEASTAEGFYEYTLYLIFSMLNVYVRTQVKIAGGRADMIVWMPETIYIFEFKTVGTAQAALKQIDERAYAKPFGTENRKVVKVGVTFNTKTRTIDDWKIEAR